MEHFEIDSITGELFYPDNLPLQVLQHNDYYIGKKEPGGTLYSRESRYWKTYEEADRALTKFLETGDHNHLFTNYVPFFLKPITELKEGK